MCQAEEATNWKKEIFEPALFRLISSKRILDTCLHTKARYYLTERFLYKMKMDNINLFKYASIKNRQYTSLKYCIHSRILRQRLHEESISSKAFNKW